MYNKLLLSAAALVASASAQSLTDLISSTPLLSTLGSLLEQYPDVADTLASASNITIFAPFNKAFQEATDDGTLDQYTSADGGVAALLSYHVVSGVLGSDVFTNTPIVATSLLTDTAYTNVTDGQGIVAFQPQQIPILSTGLQFESTVVSADNEFDGGIVHIIDRVLTIPVPVSNTAITAGLDALVGALVATDLVETVDTTPDVTIFAPVNEAFEAIGSAAADLTTQQLADILSYHVIAGQVLYSTDIAPGSVKTLGGGGMTISVDDGAVFVNAARVLETNILVANGVVHLIDSVLNPNNATAQPDTGSDTPAVQFQGASSAALGALTSGVPEPSQSFGAFVPFSTQPASASASASASSSGPAMATGAAPMQTAMVGAAALFGAGAVMANW